jgi:hypothetical protein
MFALVLVLLACRLQSDLTLYHGGRWYFEHAAFLTPQEDEAFTRNYQPQLAKMKSEAQKKGITMDTRREVVGDEVKHTAVMRGNDYAQLALIFKQPVVEPQADGTLAITIPLSGGSDQPIEFSLHTGGVVESNATEVRGNTLIWRSADLQARRIRTATAIIRPATEGNVLLPVVVVAGIASLGAGVWVVRRRQQNAVISA